MFLELVNRGSSGKLYTWQSNILLPYGSWYSPSLHLLDHDPQGAVKHSLDSRAICNMNFWCVLSREEFQERTVARVRSIRATNSESFYRRAFDNTIRTFGYGKNGEETKKREERKSGWGVAVELLQILKIFFSTENYMSRLRITYNEQTWMFTRINVKTLEEFFLSLSGRGGGW